jgi:serine/threonine protein kinase
MSPALTYDAPRPMLSYKVGVPDRMPQPLDEGDLEKPRPETDNESLDPLLLEAAHALDPNTPPVSTQRSSGTPVLSHSGGPALLPGALVAGRYRLDYRLGEGGMGEVWAATHSITRRCVAMKFLKGAASLRADMRQRFLREARVASLVHHPSVVEVLDVFELDGGVPVMVMDLLVGETLAAKLARDKVLPAAEVVALLLPAVEAVEGAHAMGIVHRDLKPDNIFLKTGEGGTITVKVLDFGIAKLTATEGDAAETGALTGTGSVVGTPWYMAPEQCYGERDIDQRADIWAFGVILYECLAGVRPVEGSSMGQLLKRLLHEGIVPIEERIPGLAPELAALMGRMLSHARESRPRGLAEVRRVLAGLAGRGASEPPQLQGKSDAVPTPHDLQRLEVTLHESRQLPARSDTDAAHAVPRPSVPRSIGASRLSLAAIALGAVGIVGWSVVHSASRGASEATIVRASASVGNAPAGTITSTPTATVVEGLAGIAGPASSASPALSVSHALSALPVPAAAAYAAALPVSPARPTEHATDKRARPVADAGNVTAVSSALAPATAQPPGRPRAPDGGLFEEIPF